MRKIIPFLSPFFVLFLSCKKINENSHCLSGKIIRIDCDRVIIEIISHERIGQETWVNALSGDSYNNVIASPDNCAILEATNTLAQPDDTLYFTASRIDSISQNDCQLQCQAISLEPPVVNYHLSKISTKPCSGTEN